METFNEKQTRTLSKFLSLVLRHQPETIGLQLDPQGWTPVADLLHKLNQKGHQVNMSLLEHVVTANDKQRFAFNDDKTRIRANQGHSIDIDLALQPLTPPEHLYHGTVAKFIPLIQADGLLKMSRQHVHLSLDLETATKVGDRRGKAIILHVRSGDMARAGHLFYRSDNGVWLTDHVPPQYIDF